MGSCKKQWQFGNAWRGLLLLVVAGGPLGSVHALTAHEMFDQMRRALLFFPNASMSQTVESDAAWNNVPGVESNASAGKVVDHWRVITDQERSGLERRRESPQGQSQTRTVYLQDRRQVFEFDPAVAADSQVLGRLIIRSQGLRGAYFRSPVLEYADRVITMSGRSPVTLDLASEQELIDGHPCHKIHGNTSGREFTVWLDEAFDCLPRQYVVQFDSTREGRGNRRFGPRPPDRRVLVAPTENLQLEQPRTSEERLISVVLDRTNGRSYLASAVLEKTQNFSNGVTYTERQSIKTESIALQPDPEAEAFLTFKGLLRDGTVVEEQQGGGPMGPELVNYYVMKNGEMTRTGAPRNGTYFALLQRDLTRLATDFSLENLRRVDSKFLIAVCALATLAINGGIAYAGHRRKKEKAS